MRGPIRRDTKLDRRLSRHPGLVLVVLQEPAPDMRGRRVSVRVAQIFTALRVTRQATVRPVLGRLRGVRWGLLVHL